MVDPRLNSIHLEPPRRHEFRQAREVLFHAGGPETFAGERLAALAGDNTLVQGRAADRGVPCVMHGQGAFFPLKIGLNTFGRMPDNDVVLSDPYVSRRHCAILVHAGDGCELHDIASKNGTFLNGRRISGPTPLQPGDEIRLCERPFVFLAGAAVGGADSRPTIIE